MTGVGPAQSQRFQGHPGGNEAFITAVTTVAARLGTKKQRIIVAHEREITEIVQAVVADLTARTAVNPVPISVIKVVNDKGEGLGPLIDIEEGRRRLDDMAVDCH